MSSDKDGASFKPYIRPDEILPELTLRALLLGSILGIIFGAASTYLALRVGLTTSASVPIAVLAAWAIKKRGEKRAVLEHNIVQTTGSAGESVAAAVVFTVPALIFLGYPLHVGVTTLIALTGGLLGVLMMVPLRRYLIVKEHGVLRYPEGKACAEIIQAGERGGTSAQKVFVGLGVGAAMKSLTALFGAVKGEIAYTFHSFKGAAAACEFGPELMGVGYIIGYRTSVMMVAGSLLASFILIPMIALFGQNLTIPVAPATVLISAMEPGDIWHNYIRHIGAGAVAAGGIFALLRALPSIGAAMSASARSLRGGGDGAQGTGLRTDRDTPIGILALGALGILAIIWVLPVFKMNLLGALLILVLGFLFSVVSSRITGEVGSSSSPLSGMTIGVLMATCGIFLLVGWEGTAYSRLALMIGAIVCIAISNAGTCSQDLKTGFLLGATPVKQQGALLIGVLSSVLAVGWTAYLLNESAAVETPVKFQVPAAKVAGTETIRGKKDGKEYHFVKLTRKDLPADQVEGNYLVQAATGEAAYYRQDGIGSEKLRAPQAKLMSTVIDGLLTHQLPWHLIMLGIALAIFMELLGVRSLTFAVGIYLPLASTMPVFLGGVIRRISDKVRKREYDADDEPHGTLFSSGIIAGASIVGILAAALVFIDDRRMDQSGGTTSSLVELLAFMTEPMKKLTGKVHGIDEVIGLVMLTFLGWLMFRGAASHKGGAKV